MSDMDNLHDVRPLRTHIGLACSRAFRSALPSGGDGQMCIPLDAPSLMDEAIRNTGLTDFGPGPQLDSIQHQPIKRVGRPADIANLAVFLASDVSSYITGQIVSVSGGAYMP